jgi:transcriptional regulator with XRE-family HTH domain
LTRYENGQRVPRAQIAARLADYYGVTVDYILGREEQFTPIEEMTPAEMRAEGLKLVKSLSAKGYEEALQYMKFLKEQENK